MIRFDRFMEAALYHPERGYYTSRIKSVGSRGDFTTTPQLSDSLAKAIALAFRQSGFKNLIEVGPGTGQLASQIYRNLPFLTKRRTQHHLVEISPILRKQQKDTFPKAQHHDDIASALAACQGEAFIYSNELVDAFPVRIFRKEESNWSELHLSGKAPQVSEAFQTTEQLPSSQLFKKNHSSSQRIEIHESYHLWLKSWLPLFKKGQVLTVDYTVPQPPPRHGTLRGYFLQDRLTGTNLYQNAGHIDLTADVHFPDLIDWSESLGLKTLCHQSQRDFLLPHCGSSRTEQYLINPEGAGLAFEVLLQEKGLS